ncbi:MAG TPA: transposase [Gaiellaceae bacterium]|nr:transposase [Gaiellaceae bacterium]
MARALRTEFPGAVYHITSRGNARGRLFLDEADEKTFLRTLGRVVPDCRWLCHAYCLMPNHFHLVLETPRPNLAVGMRRLNSSYAQAFNQRRDRIGHVFQGRYRAILIEKEAHLLEVCRYVVLNPVRAKLCETAADWRASSYRATVGWEPARPFLSSAWILGQFGTTASRARERYRAFVAEGSNEEAWRDLRGQMYLGSEDFARSRSEPGEPIEEVPRAHWRPVRRPLAELFNELGADALAVAFRDEGYHLREIAEHLGVHYSTVSRRLRALDEGGRTG